MARIPDSEIDRLKAEVSVQRLAERRGIALRRHGADLLGLCPFHDDHEPSLVISPAKNLWHCMGACQAGGSVIDWVMRTDGISFRHAVELLRADLPAGTGTGSAPGRSVTRKLAPPIEADAADAEVLGQVVAYYHETLKQSPEAQAYLASRGLDSAELVAQFRLGFADRTLGYRLPPSASVEGGALRSRLTRLGVIRPSGHEHFNGSLVVPVVDEAGNVVELYGRKITAKLRKGTPAHLYLPGPHRGVFNVGALAAADEIIVCEALIDALSFWAAGFRHVTSAYGIEGFGDEHVEAFRRHGTTRVLIAYDRDPAGDRAAAALAQRLAAMGIECFRVLFPAGTDANDVARDSASATDALGRAIRSAAWMGKGPRPATLRQAAAQPPTVSTPSQAAKEENRPGDGPNRPHPEPAAPPAQAVPVPSFAAEPLLASPVPPPAPAEPVAEIAGDEVTLHYGDRRWRVRGLGRVACCGSTCSSPGPTTATARSSTSTPSTSTRPGPGPPSPRPRPTRSAWPRRSSNASWAGCCWPASPWPRRWCEPPRPRPRPRSPSARRRRRRPWSCCVILIWWIASPPTSPGPGWWARRPTASSATWPP
ncbi:MAG: hypothetical protein QOE93_280 [Actinomycetota bacterium]|nr:hypothetical protein [Actinomycetota bacterium]